MGRARSRQTPAVPAHDFEVVFGTRRGSAAAQAGRDDVEAAERRAVLEAERVEHELIVAAELSHFFQDAAAGGAFLPELLVSAYRRSRPPAEVVAEILRWMRERGYHRRMEACRNLAYVLSCADPKHCSGLTAPALTAACDYLREGEANDLRSTKHYGALLIKGLLWDSHPARYYRRLEPLCTVLAPLIANPSAEGSAALGAAAVQVLSSAPAAALTGPLQTWVHAFASRIDNQLISPRETRGLQAVLALRASMSSTAALVELAARLEN